MPRYFFDLTVNGAGETDQQGVPFAGPDEARLEAYRVAGELASEANGREQNVLIRIRGEETGYFCEVELSIVVRNLD